MDGLYFEPGKISWRRMVDRVPSRNSCINSPYHNFDTGSYLRDPYMIFGNSDTSGAPLIRSYIGIQERNNLSSMQKSLQL